MNAPPCCVRIALSLLLAAVALAPRGARADAPPAEPLHVQIDRLIESAGGPFATLASDEEFFRRASLDLTGLPPTADDVRAFTSDADPAKRVKAIDMLLASPQHVRHLATLLDILLMERRGAAAVSADEWQQYLVASVRANKPFNVLAKELLSADGSDPATRPAARFFLDRAVEPNLLTRDIGRIFFGRDMQCAQCHDHPQIDDYKQADYQGLLAFVQASSAFTAPAPDGKLYVAERPGTEVAFESVFIEGDQHTTGPRVPGAAEIIEPTFAPGEEFTVAPAEGVRGIPKFSRRAALAEAATNGSNRWFNDNAANRLWTFVMGRGLVEPPDLHHSANPPANPDLLRLLSDELARSGFDMRAFLRELVLTKTYQRSIDLPLELSPGEVAARAEQLAARKLQLDATIAASSAAHDAAIDAWKQAVAAAAPIRTEATAARTAAAESLKARDAAIAAFNKAKADLAAKQDVSAAVAQAATASQAAAGKLPQDTEFVAATQKINERNTQLAAEVATLAQTVETQQAALIQSEVQLVLGRKALEGKWAASAPLIATIHDADLAAANARQKLTDEYTLLASVEKASESTAHIAELLKLRETATAAGSALAAAETQLAAATKAVEEYATVIAQADGTLAAAKQRLVEASQQRLAAEQEAAKRQSIAESLAGAVASASSASGLLPEDTALAETVGTLQAKAQEAGTRSTEATAAIANFQAAEQQATTAVAAAEQARQAAGEEQQSRLQAAAQSEQSLAAATAALETARTTVASAETAIVEERIAAFAAAPFKPLTAEQLCFAVLRVTGHYANHWKAEEAALTQSAPLPADATPEQIAARQFEIEQKVYDKLKGNIPAFATIYAAGAGQPQGDFFATADQALFTANGGTVLSWLALGGGNLSERMNNQADPQALAADLYLTVLSRSPGEAEVAATTAYLAARPQEKSACVQELIWALLTSAEFRFNH